MANIVMGLTRLGLRLYGKVQTGTELEITGVRVGDGYLAPGDTIEELAALKSPVDTEVTVTDYSIIGDGQTALNLSIDSAEEDYCLREIGVFASDPDAGEILYAYCNFGENADFISSYNDGYTVPQEGIIYIAIGNTPDITVNVEGAAAVTRAEFAAHRDDTGNPHKVTAAQVGFTNKDALDKITDEAISRWNEMSGSSHTHDNKDVLDAITAAVKAGYDAAVTHTQSRANPHNVTAAQVGLGNVTNESKATMFRNPTFTGIPTAPTPAFSNDNSQRIATTAFVQNAKLFTYSSASPVRVGTWIDGTPVWRMPYFEVFASSWTSGSKTLDIPVKSYRSNFFILQAAITAMAGSGPSDTDDDAAPYVGNRDVEYPSHHASTTSYSGLYGFVEFVTPESNID